MLKTSKHSFLRSVVFALLAFPTGSASAETTIDFGLHEGLVVPTESYAAKVTVLGAAITSDGEDVPVTVKIRIGDQVMEPFGSYENSNTGNVNIHSGPRRVIFDQIFDPRDEIEVTASSWLDGEKYLERNSHIQSPAVRLLRDGDDVPEMAGYDNQEDAVYFIRKYIDPDTNKMQLEKNQAIYLFELGTTNMNTSAADFQDLVVLVTLGQSPEELDRLELIDASYD